MSLLLNIEEKSIAEDSGIKTGDKIFHEKFGTGIITELSGSWPETRAVIEFEKWGPKTLMLKFARLEKK